jgi:hypothetical protein
MKKSFIAVIMASLILFGVSFAATHGKITTHKSATKIEKVATTTKTEVKKPVKKQNWFIRKAKSAKWRVTHMFKKHKK